MSNTKHLADLLKVCSILPALAILPAMADVPQPVDGKVVGQTIANETSRIYDFSILNSDLEISDSNFVNNSNNDWGGVTHLTGGHNLTINNSDFTGNYSSVAGGAVSSGTKADTLKVDGVQFVNNHAREDGGAIASYRGLQISNSVFDGNTAQYDKDENGNWNQKVMGSNPVGGGALALGAVSETKIAAISSTTFKNNVSGVNGGAIGTRLARGVAADWTYTTAKNANSAKLDIAATFEDNFAKRSGGAIYNTFYADNGLGKGEGVTVTGVFDDNEAGYRGGAIYNDGDKDYNGNGAVMTINNATFTDNEAGDNGGAIYNTGKLVIDGTSFKDNEAGQWAGAVYNSGRTDNKDLNMAKVAEIETDGDLVIKNSTFVDNSALYGGALVAGTTAKNTYIENTKFEGNSASELGAVALFSSATLNNVQFINNKATTTTVDISVDGGGALFLGSNSATDVHGVLENSVFSSNSSGINGGAVATRTFVQGDNRCAILDISDTMFVNNVAGTIGGAIDNYFYHSTANADAVYVKGSQFVNNSATHGGAVYNHGSTSLQLSDKPSTKNNTLKQAGAIEFANVKFVDNKASVAGGAIYNELGGTVILSGENTFAGNIAGKYDALNDIHNLGTLTVKDGSTSFGGGITGNGTLNLSQGATMNIGTSTIHQGTIDLQGTVVADALNNRDFGRFVGDVVVGQDAKFELNVGAVGTYDIWNGTVVAMEQVSVGDIYEIASVDSNGITIVTKSVDAIAEEVGITEQAAGVVASLANATSGKAHQVSLALQDALNAGDAEFVEQETKKLNPDDKPVAHAVSSSVQNQVLSLTAGRMGGGVILGRAGGDEVTQENGFWMQGLFNKSKFADQFHGYTRGVALGADTLIDNKWTIGGGLAFNNSDVHADARHTDIDSKTLFLYGQYKPNKWFMNATATYTMSEYSEDVALAGGVHMNNTYDVDSYGTQLVTGYDFATGITTEAGVRYLHIAQDSYVGEFGTDVKASETDFLSGVAGLKYAFAIENDWAIQLRPEMRAAMTYDFISDDTQTTVVLPGVASYKVASDRLSRFGGEFGIGLTALYHGMEISVMYDLDLHKDYTSQTGMIKFRTQF